MNTKQKGNKVENDVKKILEKQGFIVIKSPRTMKMIGKGRFMSQANDFWGLYDLCAKTHKFTRWIQCKSTSSGTSEAKPNIERFQRIYNSKFEMSEIWQKVPYKGYVVYYLGEDFKNWEKIFLDLKGNEVEPFVINTKKEMKK